MKLGWRGKPVRHVDGRQGRIVDEDAWFGNADLHIRQTDGGRACVEFRTPGKDGGEPGWCWWCPDFDQGARWLPLGDHWQADREMLATWPAPHSPAQADHV